MSDSSLPGYLKKVLEHHMSESSLDDNDEMRLLVAKLDKLKSNVEVLKQQALAKRKVAIAK